MYPHTSLPIRPAIAASHHAALERFVSSGTWFWGHERHAMLKEARYASLCRLCAESRMALSPFITKGDHDSVTDLPEQVIEVIHRLVTDSGRLTEAWFQSVVDGGLSAEAYIEIVGLVASVIVLDSYARGLGEDLLSIDAPRREDSPPLRKTNPDVVDKGAWVPILAAEETPGATLLPSVPNILRAMGLVPSAIQQFFDIMRAHYGLANLESALSRPQIELVAARMSSYNDCFY